LGVRVPPGSPFLQGFQRYTFPDYLAVLPVCYCGLAHRAFAALRALALRCSCGQLLGSRLPARHLKCACARPGASTSWRGEIRVRLRSRLPTARRFSTIGLLCRRIGSCRSTPDLRSRKLREVDSWGPPLDKQVLPHLTCLRLRGDPSPRRRRRIVLSGRPLPLLVAAPMASEPPSDAGAYSHYGRGH
jgi:hypothetical protein